MYNECGTAGGEARLPVDEGVQRGEGDEGEEGGSDEAADHDDGQGAFDFDAVEAEDEEGEQAEDGGAGGHKFGADAADGGFARAWSKGRPFAVRALTGDEDEAVLDGDAEEADQADEGGDVPALAGDQEGEDATDEGVGQRGEDDQGFGGGA